jgi:hypothetical protein
MTTEMNLLLERLQEAIDEAISDSGQVNAIVDEMKRFGYDVCLIVESSAAISPVAVSPTEDTRVPDSVPDPRLFSNVPYMSATNGDIPLSAEDLAFLQEMKIAA